MTLLKKAIFDEIIKSLEETYTTFLAAYGLLDHHIVKLGFYAAAEHMFERDPLPDEEMQNSVLAHLSKIKHELMAEYLEVIESTLLDVSEARSVS